MTKLYLVATFVMLIVASGCTTIDSGWLPKAPWNKKDKVVESDYDAPVRMAAIWTPDVLTQPGLPASRGFGGRLYFYNQMNKPVKVEGQLVVYAYDDSATEQQRESPDRKYAFTPEQFTNHHSDSELGPSYSVWLPWDGITSGEQMGISLLPVFTSSSGKIVMGQQALNLLPGKKRESVPDAGQPSTLSQRASTGVRPAAYQDNSRNVQSTELATAEAPPSQPSFTTTTINLPKAMQQRVIEAAQNRISEKPIGTPDPELLEKARATLERLRTNSQDRAEAGAPAMPSPSARFAPPRPRVPSSPTSLSAFSHAPSRPVQPVQRFDPPSSLPPTLPMATAKFGTNAEQSLY